jgi:hypothetical protein
MRWRYSNPPPHGDPSLEDQVPVFISLRNMVTQLYSRALGSLSVASYDSQSYGRGIVTRHHTGKFRCSVLAAYEAGRQGRSEKRVPWEVRGRGKLKKLAPR